MKLKNAFVALAATGMVATPVAAQANTTAAAGTVKVAKAERKATAVRGKHQAVQGTTLLIGVLAAAAVAGGIVVATDDNKSKGS